MSKIKTTKLEPRAEEGTLTIGTDEGPSTTQFEGTVLIPGYATVDYVDQIVAGDISVELGAYQKRDEKNQNAGYAGLDDTGRVPADRIDTDVLGAEVDQHHEQISTNTAKIAQLESATAFQIEYYMGNLAGTDPAINYMSINAATWAGTTLIKINKTDAGGAVHDFSAIKLGDTLWFADVTPDGAALADVDTTGLFTVGSNTDNTTFNTFEVTMQSANGGPQVGDRIEAQIFPAFDVSSKADVTYVDTNDNWIKKNYLPLTGGQSHKMTGDIYMQDNSVRGLDSTRTSINDAVSYLGADRDYLRRDGVDNGLTGDLDANDNELLNVSKINLTGDRTIDVELGVAGMLQYNGQDKFKWGSSFVWSFQDLDMQDHKIINVVSPTDDKDAATKKYVDDNTTGSTPIEIGTSVAPPSRPKGSMYLTTGGNVYVYT